MSTLQTHGLEAAPGFQSAAARRETAQSDDDLLQRVATGDQAALRALVTRYQVRVYRFVLRALNDQGRAEDVVNDTFLAVWQRAASFERRSSVGTWILAIARYKALTARTQSRVCDETITAELAETLVDGRLGPEDELAGRDQASMIRECINALPKHHSELLDLVYYHERSIQEVALIVGIPENTVKSRMFHARRKLGEMLAAKGVVR